MYGKARTFFADQVNSHPQKEAIKDSMAIGILGALIRMHTRGTEQEEIANASLARIASAVAEANGITTEKLWDLSKDTAAALTTARALDEREGPK